MGFLQIVSAGAVVFSAVSVYLSFVTIRDLRERIKFNEDQFSRLREVTEGIVKYLKEHT